MLPEDPADLADLRVGDVGIKRKRWYVEGYERFDEHGTLLRCDPKGLEIRTRIHAVDRGGHRRAPRRPGAGSTTPRPRAGWASPRSGSTRSARSTWWSRRSTRGSGCTGWARRRSARPTCTWSTYGPDLNLSWAGSTPDELIDAARKLTALSPYLVPLSFSSPFRDGGPWGGLSARTAVRTGAAARGAGVPRRGGAAGAVRPVTHPARPAAGGGGASGVQGVRRLPGLRALRRAAEPADRAGAGHRPCAQRRTTPDAAAAPARGPRGLHRRRAAGRRGAGTRRRGRGRRGPPGRHRPAGGPCATASTATTPRPAPCSPATRPAQSVAGLAPYPARPSRAPDPAGGPGSTRSAVPQRRLALRGPAGVSCQE